MIDGTGAARIGLYDVEAQRWSDELLAAFGSLAPWLRPETLPRPMPGGELAAELGGAAAGRLGLAEGLPVVAGAHDQAAAFLGAGGIAGRTSVIGFGSSDCVSVGSATRPASLHGTGFATYRVDSSMWITLAGTAAGGWSLDWFARTVGRPVAAAAAAGVGARPALPSPRRRGGPPFLECGRLAARLEREHACRSRSAAVPAGTSAARRTPPRSLPSSTHWLRHTTLTWVERNFGYAVARAYAGHNGSRDVGVTTTYVRADITEVARALAGLTAEAHPLACAPDAGRATSPAMSLPAFRSSSGQ